MRNYVGYRPDVEKIREEYDFADKDSGYLMDPSLSDEDKELQTVLDNYNPDDTFEAYIAFLKCPRKCFLDVLGSGITQEKWLQDQLRPENLEKWKRDKEEEIRMVETAVSKGFVKGGNGVRRGGADI